MTKNKKKTIITIDPEGCGVPEDGFGIDDDGYFFIAVSKGGFREDRKCVVFIFKDNIILTKTEFVSVKNNFFVNNFFYLFPKLDLYEKLILEHLFDKYAKIKGVSRKEILIYENRHVGSVNTNVLTHVYKRLGKKFNCNRINIKVKKYRFVFDQVDQYSLMI